VNRIESYGKSYLHLVVVAQPQIKEPKQLAQKEPEEIENLLDLGSAGVGLAEQVEDHAFFVPLAALSEEDLEFLASYVPQHSDHLELPKSLLNRDEGLNEKNQANLFLDAFSKEVDELRKEQATIQEKYTELINKIEGREDEDDLILLGDDKDL